jgi:transcription elongation factor Elf1
MNQSCVHTLFSYEEAKPLGANRKIGIVRCNQCGTAIGVFLPEIAAALEVINQKLDDLQHRIG